MSFTHLNYVSSGMHVQPRILKILDINIHMNNILQEELLANP